MLYRCNYVGIVGGGKNPKYPKNKGVRSIFNSYFIFKSSQISISLAIVWDDYQKKVAISLEFNADVLAIKLRRDRIAVVFEKLLKVYSFSQTPQLLHVFETYSNPSGFCCLCSHSSNANLAYLGRKCGSVVVIDLANTEKPPVEIMAHETAISCMTMSNDGLKLATSSTKVFWSLRIFLNLYLNNTCDFFVKGTLIRVFDTDNGVLLHELRRGANHANIFW